jgi:hypothetical protein
MILDESVFDLGIFCWNYWATICFIGVLNAFAAVVAFFFRNSLHL